MIVDLSGAALNYPLVALRAVAILTTPWDARWHAWQVEQ